MSTPTAQEVPITVLRQRGSLYPPLSRTFSPVNYKNQKFVILDCPTDSTLPTYLTELLNRHVTDVVRVCEPTYNAAYLADRHVKVHEMYFKDGGVPPANVVSQWLHLVEERFGPFPVIKKGEKDGRSPSSDNLTAADDKGDTIAVHCVAGLGRAPVLVAIALIEAGMPALEAVEYIRKYRRGAFNSVQINYLDSYKRGQFRSAKSALSSMGKGLLGRAGTPTPGAHEDAKKGGRPPSPPKHADSRTPSPGPDASGSAVTAAANGGQAKQGWLGNLFKSKKPAAPPAGPPADQRQPSGGNVGHREMLVN